MNNYSRSSSGYIYTNSAYAIKNRIFKKNSLQTLTLLHKKEIMHKSFSGIRYENGIFQEVNDSLVVEEILHVHINNLPYTITMRTPGFEEELVRGILLSEDVYKGSENPVFYVEKVNDEGYVTHVNIEILNEKLDSGIETKRNLMSVTSCGMCGKEETTLTLVGEKIEQKYEINPIQILRFFQQMKSVQSNFKQTGGSHAAAIFSKNETLLACYEDIGRHNAVDKVIGSLLLKNELQQSACLVVSGRISYEIVSKCYKARIPYLAAVSAPSSMAVNFCKEKGIKLIGFCRENKLTLYS